MPVKSLRGKKKALTNQEQVTSVQLPPMKPGHKGPSSGTAGQTQRHKGHTGRAGGRGSQSAGAGGRPGWHSMDEAAAGAPSRCCC